MRQLATLYQAFKDLYGVSAIYSNSLDMFCRQNFDELCFAVEVVTTNEDKTMKAGSRQTLYYLLLKSLKKLRDKMYLDKKDDIFKELSDYYIFFKSNEDTFILSARYQLENNRLTKVRKPSQLPLEDDIVSIHCYIKRKMKELCNEYAYWCTATFVELRNLVMSRLTLWNGRRGGETGRLTIAEWKDGFSNGWIDKQKMGNLSDADKMLVESMKIVFQAGKGNRHLVSLLIPEDTVPGLEKLTDLEVRKSSGVSDFNPYIFASTQNSELNFSGWHAMKEVCGKLDLHNPDLINATNNRHRISTLYASMDIPEKERELFYTHMGHSSDVNKNVYQAPLAIQGVTKVGKQLMQIERGLLESKKGQHSGSTCQKSKRRASSDSDIESPEISTPKTSKVKRRKIDVSDHFHETSSSESEEDIIDDGDSDSRDLSKEVSTKTDLRRRSAKWDVQKHKRFMEIFGAYVRREAKNPFPSTTEMKEFLNSIGNPFPVFSIRTKINNERKKRDNIVSKRLADMAMPS